jgi:hypothetical protein
VRDSLQISAEHRTHQPQGESNLHTGRNHYWIRNGFSYGSRNSAGESNLHLVSATTELWIYSDLLSELEPFQRVNNAGDSNLRTGRNHYWIMNGFSLNSKKSAGESTLHLVIPTIELWSCQRWNFFNVWIMRVIPTYVQAGTIIGLWTDFPWVARRARVNPPYI